MGGLATVDLQSDESLCGEIFLVGILEVRPRHSIKPGLDTLPLAPDDDRIPVVPPEGLLPPVCEFPVGSLAPGLCELPGIEPAAPGLIVNAGRVGPVPVVVVLALVAEHASISVALRGSKLAAGVAARVAELELKDEHKVPVAFPRAQEGVAPDVLAEAHDGAIVHLVLSRPAGLAPAVESLSVKEGRIAGLLKSLRNGCWRHGFPMTGRSQEGEKDSGKVQGLHA